MGTSSFKTMKMCLLLEAITVYVLTISVDGNLLRSIKVTALGNMQFGSLRNRIKIFIRY